MNDVVDYEEAVAAFDPVLGIEVHVELGTRTKMFDGAPVAFGGEPNSRVTPVSLGLPGSLPKVNRAAVESAIRIGLALGCEIAESSARVKHARIGRQVSGDSLRNPVIKLALF